MNYKQKKKAEKNAVKMPVCCLCAQCYKAQSKKHEGMAWYCVLTGNDVSQSHFGLNSPKDCPRRNGGEK